jgi:hypothetical protein
VTTRQHGFLPYERRFAGYAVERQRTHSNAFNVRMQDNYGPEGIRLYWAAIADLVLGWGIGMTGLATLLLSIEVRALRPISVGMVLLGMVVVSLGCLRLAQGARAGRIYRAGRPYIRGPRSRFG